MTSRFQMQLIELFKIPSTLLAVTGFVIIYYLQWLKQQGSKTSTVVQAKVTDASNFNRKFK